MQEQPKTKKVKATVTEDGHPREIEIEVPVDTSVTWTYPGKTRYVGKRISRVDGSAKVSGSAKYAYDIVLPGLCYGRFLRSPHAKARVSRIDVSVAEKMPGVKAVITDFGKGIRYAGQEIAAVAAVSEEILEDALRAIKVEYDIAPYSATTAGARKPGASIAMRGESNLPDPNTRTQGDLAAGFAAAAHVVENTYGVPVKLHTCLETHGSTARWDDDEHLTLWCSTQSVFGVRGEIANAVGIPQTNVHVICEYMGGGFGSKFGARIEGATAARLAKIAKAPVKMMLPRKDDQIATGNGPDAHATIKIGCDKEGKITAFECSAWGTGGASEGWSVPLPYIYRVGSMNVTMQPVITNAGISAAMRAPGHPQASFLMESAMDDLAAKAGIDPVEFRILNDANGRRREQFRRGAELIGWSNRNKTPGKAQNRLVRGIGCGASTWGGGGGGGSQAEVSITRDGKVESSIGTQDLGTGTRTYVAAIVADELGIDITQVKANIGDSRLGRSGGSGGSVTTASVAPTVKMAATNARLALCQLAAAKLGVPPETLEMRDGKIAVIGRDMSLTFKEVCRLLPAEGLHARGEWNPELQQGGVAGCQFAEVEVDQWTGRVQVKKVVAVHDCGLVINRLAVESQINGGVIQGLAMALFEERIMDEQTGRCLNPNMEFYKLPGSLEMPEIMPVIWEYGATKVTGIGEPPVIPTAAAIANAVFNATGVRVHDLPITPAKLLPKIATGTGV